MLVNRARSLAPFSQSKTLNTASDASFQPEPFTRSNPHRNQTHQCFTYWRRRFLNVGCIVLLLLFALVANETQIVSPQHLSQHALLHPIDNNYRQSRNNNTVVAYAISLIKCSDEQSTPAGLTDAALVLRHSVHLQSSRNPASGSKYDYKMYALIHPQAIPCSHVLEQVGFNVVLVQPPIQISDIQNKYLRENIETEWCCGSDEFIKLHAFLLPEPVVVHSDIDFAFLKPMDDLYDALLFDASSSIGKAARARISLEKRSVNATLAMPREVHAFITRDWPQVMPGRIAGYQAGLLVARRSPQVYEELVHTIKTSNYTPGYGRENGWGGRGYGAFLGAMAMQGIIAYYYDIIRPNTAVELNQCRYNWMGMQVRYNAEPNFKPRHPKVGHCRNDGDFCEDCRYTTVDLIHNVHYTLCRKPWLCVSVGAGGGHSPDGGKAIDTDAGNLDACLVMIRKWHEFRTDLEKKWYDLTHDTLIKQGQSAEYNRDFFQGHCRNEGGANYIPIQADPLSFSQIANLYK